MYSSSPVKPQACLHSRTSSHLRSSSAQAATLPADDGRRISEVMLTPFVLLYPYRRGAEAATSLPTLEAHCLFSRFNFVDAPEKVTLTTVLASRLR